MSDLFESAGAAVAEAEEMGPAFAEAEIARLAGELADAEAENTELRKEIEQLETDVATHEEAVKDAERAEQEAEDAIEMEAPQVAALELYADPANWTGHTFTPVMPQMFNDPYDPARRALDGRAS